MNDIKMEVIVNYEDPLRKIPQTFITKGYGDLYLTPRSSSRPREDLTLHVNTRMLTQPDGSVYKITPGEVRPVTSLIERVLFYNPATIVYWKDGTKTVVKTQDGEVFDKEKGLAMAIAKKVLGNEGNYYETFKKYTSEDIEKDTQNEDSDYCI